jgi:hypothetical protein
MIWTTLILVLQKKTVAQLHKKGLRRNKSYEHEGATQPEVGIHVSSTLHTFTQALTSIQSEESAKAIAPKAAESFAFQSSYASAFRRWSLII